MIMYILFCIHLFPCEFVNYLVKHKVNQIYGWEISMPTISLFYQCSRKVGFFIVSYGL
jgi:hypothetical protein